MRALSFLIFAVAATFSLASSRGDELHRKINSALQELAAGRAVQAGELLGALKNPRDPDFQNALRSCVLSRRPALDAASLSRLAGLLWERDEDPATRAGLLLLVGNLHATAGNFGAFLTAFERTAGRGDAPGRFRAAFYLALIHGAQLDHRSAYRWMLEAVKAPSSDTPLWSAMSERLIILFGSEIERDNLTARILRHETLPPARKMRTLLSLGPVNRSGLLSYWMRERPGEWCRDCAPLLERTSAAAPLIAADPVAIAQLEEAAASGSQAHTLLLAIVQYAANNEERAAELARSLLKSPVVDGLPTAEEVTQFPNRDRPLRVYHADAARFEALRLLAKIDGVPLTELAKQDLDKRPTIHAGRKLLWLKAAYLLREASALAEQLLGDKNGTQLSPELAHAALNSITGPITRSAARREHVDMLWQAVTNLAYCDPPQVSNCIDLMGDVARPFPRPEQHAKIVRHLWSHTGGSALRYELEDWMRLAPAYSFPEGFVAGIAPELPQGFAEGMARNRPSPGNGPLWGGFLIDFRNWHVVASGLERGRSGRLYAGGYDAAVYSVSKNGTPLRSAAQPSHADQVVNAFRPSLRRGLNRNQGEQEQGSDPGEESLLASIAERPEDIHLKLLLAQHLLASRGPVSRRPIEARNAQQRELAEQELAAARKRAVRALALLDALPEQRGARAVMITELMAIAATRSENADRLKVLQPALAALRAPGETDAKPDWQGDPPDDVTARMKTASQRHLKRPEPPRLFDRRRELPTPEQARQLWMEPLAGASSRFITDRHRTALKVLDDQRTSIAGILTELDALLGETDDVLELRFRMFTLRRSMVRSKKPRDNGERFARDARILLRAGLTEPEFILAAALVLANGDDKDKQEAWETLRDALLEDPVPILEAEALWLSLMAPATADELAKIAGITTAKLMEIARADTLHDPTGPDRRRAIYRRTNAALRIASQLSNHGDADADLADRLRIAALGASAVVPGHGRADEKILAELRGQVDGEQALFLARMLLLPKADLSAPREATRGNYVWSWRTGPQGYTSAGLIMLQMLQDTGKLEEYLREEDRWIERHHLRSSTRFLAKLIQGGNPWEHEPGRQLTKRELSAVGKLELSPEARDAFSRQQPR